MKYKHFLGLSILMMNVAFAQVNENQQANQNVPKQSLLDSIKSKFVYHETAACVDDRWVEYYMNEDLFQQMERDLEIVADQDTVVFDLSTKLLKKRLLHLDSKSAFNITYNPHLEQSIKYYLKNRKRSFERLIGMSEYYFPFFEEALAKYNLPLEIKYLAIVESALNPKAVSRVGATGLWQFMYGTAKQYKLEVNTYVDERSDLLKATDAACQYMSNMYQIFGDWDMVLASYNAGPGNVSKAIRRSGGKQNYWNIRPFLPKETQGYVPAFLATMYVYEFYKEHGFEPQKFTYKPMMTDTILVKQNITFKQLSDLLDMSLGELQFLNPSYKRDFVPFQTDKKHFIRLPLDKIAVMTSNEALIYSYVTSDFAKAEQPSEQVEVYVEEVKYHTVRKGDNLGKIANKYDVSVTNLKKWNGLKSNNITVGKKLKIESGRKVIKQVKKPETDVATKPVENKNEAVAIAPQSAIETAEIAPDSLVSEPEVANVQEESKQEVAKKRIHKIQKGESLFLVSKKYNVSIDDLKKWNQLESNKINVGTELIVFSDVDVLTTESEESTQVSQRYKTYLVQKGDSLYSISQKLKSVTVTDLKKWNALKNSEIKPGMKLIVQKP
ncbi:MAG: LysM peptidoglycan-binding domain-containing protein [Flavobacterium sp.]